MDAFTDPAVETIVLCFPAQIGKTEVALNAIGYAIDEDPGPILVVYPTERDSDKAMRSRVHRMLRNSPRLARHLPRGEGDLGLKEVNLDSCSIYAAWANSPSALASTPIRYVILDETDKYPPFSGREASPVKLAEVRTRTYRGRRKLIIVSTPTIEHGTIWQAYQASDRREYWVPCPSCGAFQVLDFFSGVKWSRTVAPSVAVPRSAWYECSACRAQIHDEDKARMLARGLWVPAGCSVAGGCVVGEPERPPIRAGFNLSALYSPWTTFAEVAREFILSVGDAENMMNFHNSWLARPWIQKAEAVSEARIRSRRGSHEPGTVPAGALVLVAGVDVQEDAMYYSIRAWGARERSWGVRFGVVGSKEELERVLLASYRRVDGVPMRVRRAYVDSGYRTEEIYKLCRQHRPIFWPSKGVGDPKVTLSARVSRPEPGVLLTSFKADFFKDKLHRLIHAPDGGPGEWRTARDVDEDYIRQLSAERRVLQRIRGRLYSHWEPVTTHAANHFWDCEVLCTLAADAEGIRYLDDEPARRDEPAGRPNGPTDHESQGWLQPENLLQQERIW